jgi:alcohol dehydrogenase, propanol-preferring
VRALQLTAANQPFELREVPQPDPRPGEVLVKVGGAGACHSDLHFGEWPAEVLELLGFTPPFTLGHENAGWVEALGDGVSDVEVGQPVAVYGPWGCGRCWDCRASARTTARRTTAPAEASASTAASPSTCWCPHPGTCCRWATSTRW